MILARKLVLSGCEYCTSNQAGEMAGMGVVVIIHKQENKCKLYNVLSRLIIIMILNNILKRYFANPPNDDYNSTK